MEKRKKTMSILLKNESKTATKIELFPAEQWAGEPNAAPRDLFRLRIDGCWYNQGDAKYTFLSLIGVAKALERLLGDNLGVKTYSVPPRVEIPYGTPVRVPNGNTLGGKPMYDLTRTATEPILGFDGRWHVGVILIGQGAVMMPVDEMEVQK